jgi:ABC-type glycerol-3-phosphate transport system substrate-binding protein
LAISKNSANQEIAWEFVKSMISKEYQTNYIYYSIPIHKSAFEKHMESAMEKELYVDEEGNEVETAKMIYGYDDIEVEIYAARKEQVEEYRKIVEGATTLATYDQQIMLMVEEEIEAFFDNKKSAEEVAKIVQSRVKIYVNEIK